jgi:hypothetical protein
MPLESHWPAFPNITAPEPHAVIAAGEALNILAPLALLLIGASAILAGRARARRDLAQRLAHQRALSECGDWIGLPDAAKIAGEGAQRSAGLTHIDGIARHRQAGL